jgi:hypothetical protein
MIGVLAFTGVGIVGWLVCSWLAYRAAFTYYQTEYALIAETDRPEDRRRSIIFGLLFGPILLAVIAMDTKLKHGFTPPSLEEVREMARRERSGLRRGGWYRRGGW